MSDSYNKMVFVYHDPNEWVVKGNRVIDYLSQYLGEWTSRINAVGIARHLYSDAAWVEATTLFNELFPGHHLGEPDKQTYAIYSSDEWHIAKVYFEGKYVIFVSVADDAMAVQLKLALS